MIGDRNYTSKPGIDVEAILLKTDRNNILIKVDETAKPIWLPRSHIKIVIHPRKVVSQKPRYITMTLSESKATYYGLV